jgi:hypothetical protein
MGILVQAGQLAIAGQGAGQANQYYGYSDTNSTTVTTATYGNLSTVYTIPAGEAYAGASYELECGGSGTWGSTQQSLRFGPYLDGTFTNTPGVAAAALAANAAFAWWAKLTVTCVDGISGWWGVFAAVLQESASLVSPGTASTNSIALAGSNTGVRTAAVASPVAVAIQCEWGSTTGAPTITNNLTKFRKVA